LSKIETQTAVRKEMACSDGLRCDVFIHGNPAEIIEFSTRRVDKEKAYQLIAYLDDPIIREISSKVDGTLVAVSYEGDSSSRIIKLDGRKLRFFNWHDYLRELVTRSQQATDR
jgi:hypothetical protein